MFQGYMEPSIRLKGHSLQLVVYRNTIGQAENARIGRHVYWFLRLSCRNLISPPPNVQTPFFYQHLPLSTSFVFVLRPINNGHRQSQYHVGARHVKRARREGTMPSSLMGNAAN